jgi:hypothetical protein
MYRWDNKMLDRIYKIPIADSQWDEINPKPSQSALIATDGTDDAYLVGSGGFAAWDALIPASIVGSWDSSTGLQEGESYDNNEPPNVIGTPTHPVTADYTGWIRVLGNNNRSATGVLDSTRWAGHAEAKYLLLDHRYTDSDDPFTLTIERTDNTYADWDAGTTYDTGDKVMHDGQGWASQQTNNTNHEPGQAGSGPWWAVTASGYGWLATMIEPSASQGPITGYNIRVYPTADCTPGTQIYTSGNFSNGSGSFTTESTSNQWTPTADAVNIALIFVGGGNSQNGIITMDVGQDEVTAEFWSHDQ